MTRLELADRTGVIGGGPPKPLPIRPDAIVSPHRPPLEEPPRAARFDCLAFGASCKYARLVDGSGVAHPMACRKCQPCREWRVFRIMVRYRHGIGEQQTFIILPGFPNVDTARKWVSLFGRANPLPRISILTRTPDYLWAGIIIYASGLNPKGQDKVRRALVRMGTGGTIETRPVPP